MLAAIEIAAAGIFRPVPFLNISAGSDSVPESVLREAVRGLLWVALDGNGQPVGYALVLQLKTSHCWRRWMCILITCVKGIGSALIGHVAEHLRLREKTALYLTTFSIFLGMRLLCKTRIFNTECDEIPQFINEILDEEKRYGLTSRVAMRLKIQ